MILRTNKAVVLSKSRKDERPTLINWFGLMAAVAFLLIATAVSAQDVTRSYAISKYGDVKYPADFAHLDYVNPDAPKGGEYSTWAFGTFDTLHPYIVKGTYATGASIQFESLFVGTADETDTMYGLLASELEYPDDYSWVIFHMRPEAMFSDGTPVTAHDVVFSHEILKEKGIPSIRVIFSETFSNVEALDDHTVKFYLQEEERNIDNIMVAASSTVFSKSWWEGRDFAEPTLDAPVGSAEYILDKMVPGKTITFRLRDDYWGKDLPINVGRSNFTTLRFEYYADSTAAFEGFKAGETWFRNENSSLSWAQDYTFPAIESGAMLKVELPDGNIGQAQAFLYNLREAPFDDIRVREALGIMFNFEWSNKTLFFGLYSRVDSFWENSVLEATGMIPDDERAILEPLAEYFPESLFTETAVTPPVSSDQQVDRAQIRAAGALLDDAGWPVGDDGMRRNAAGEVLAIDILNYTPTWDRIINPYIENLKLLGIEATHTRIDSTQYTERVNNFDFDMIVGTIANSLTPSIGLKQWFASENAMEPSRNRGGLDNEGIDKLIDLVIAAKDRDELNLRTRALDRALRSLHIWVPQWYKDVHSVAYFDFYRHPDPEIMPPFALGMPDFWWFDQEAFDRLKAAGDI